MSEREDASIRVLFVDDEPRVLDGLRRLMRSRRHEWDMRFACSGAEALQTMASAPADVVVTDMRMPEMDGAELLTQVRERYPQTVRMILSGHSDQDAALRAVQVAHQFLNKPCDGATLTAAIERAIAPERHHGLEALRRAIGQVDSRPSPPATWLALNRELADPDAGVRTVAEIVRGDVAMSAKLLQVVNSSFLGLARHVSDVDEAVVYLGLQVIRSLALSVEVFRSFEPRGRLGSDFCDRIGRHGAACARRAKALVPGEAGAQAAFTAALLQDAGQLLLAAKLPELFEANLEAASAAGVPLHVMERRQSGFTHADAGAYLFSLWGLPAMVVEAVARHHEPLPPELAPGLSLDAVACPRLGAVEGVQLAHRLVQRDEPEARDLADVAEPAHEERR